MRKSWTSPVSIQTRNKEIKRGNYVELPLLGVKVAYEWGLASSKGAYFILIKSAEITDEILKIAGKKLKFERDVVDLTYAEIETCPNCGTSDEFHPFELTRLPVSNHWCKCVLCDHEWNSDNYRE